MKILHVIPSFGLGGMEKVVCSIINHTYRQYQHVILSLDGNDKAFRWIKSDNIERIEFYKDSDFLDFLKRLYGAIHTVSPDLLMTYNWGATDAIWVGRLAGIKRIIHSEHGFSIEEARITAWKRDLCRFVVYRMASALITVSSNLKYSFQKKYWLSHEHVQMIPNGIDAHYYSPDESARQRIRQELKFEATDFVIVFSGRLDPVKNFDLLLSVFDHCRPVENRMKLLIVGEGPERPNIEQLCLRKNIHQSVVMVGEKLEVLPYLRAGDVFLLTSVTEQMPLTILEAMSVGLPVIASDVGEIRHIIEDGQDGFLRNIGDGCEEFASAVLRLQDFPQRQAMGQAARTKIVIGFQETMMAQRYQTTIDNLLPQHRH
jgi:glycosyltransferase involved in cell wall biosynthesis